MEEWSGEPTFWRKTGGSLIQVVDYQVSRLSIISLFNFEKL
jgi:hypothetical protein